MTKGLPRGTGLYLVHCQAVTLQGPRCQLSLVFEDLLGIVQIQFHKCMGLWYTVSLKIILLFTDSAEELDETALLNNTNITDLNSPVEVRFWIEKASSYAVVCELSQIYICGMHVCHDDRGTQLARRRRWRRRW
jgi:hypothetical protein